MSYVITSNVESEDVLLVGGYSDPATYLNNFRSPLLLDIDSEGKYLKMVLELI